MVKILPSLASADQLHLEYEIQKVEFLKHLHLDIEDGNFVPNITFGLKTIKSVCAVLKGVCCDVHLMVTNPMDYVDSLAEIGVDAIAFHWEIVPYPMRVIGKIHKLGLKAGIALNPRTSVEEIRYYLRMVDYVLLMSSEPDDMGEKFQKITLEKIRWIREMDKEIEIIVDGGIHEHNFQDIVLAGASGAVLGRAIFREENAREFVIRLQEKGK
ncbi:MAG: ribulose-phosphate 3-epimerase [Clostridiales bacterium]|nr:ribulose-phosphate 3-epimerase [Clostridiales bacterium]